MPKNKKQFKRISVLIRMLKRNDYPNYEAVLEKMRKEDASIYFTRKTFQRDIAYLKSDLEAPIDYNKAKCGYEFTGTWTCNLLLDETEMDAVALGTHVAEAVLPDSKLQNSIRQGVDELLAKSTNSKELADAIMQSLIIFSGVAKIQPEVFQTIFSKWCTHHTIQIWYGSGKEGVVVEPHVIAQKDNVWYLHARKVGDSLGNFHNYALHRIRKVEVVGKSFEPDRREIGRVRQGKLFDLPYVTGARLRLWGEARRQVVNKLPLQATETQTDGSVVVTIEEVNEYQVLNFVLTARGEADILAPDALREAARQEARKVLETLEKSQS